MPGEDYLWLQGGLDGQKAESGDRKSSGSTLHIHQLESGALNFEVEAGSGQVGRQEVLRRQTGRFPWPTPRKSRSSTDVSVALFKEEELTKWR